MDAIRSLRESLEFSLADIRYRQRQLRRRLEELEREEDQTVLALREITKTETEEDV